MTLEESSIFVNLKKLRRVLYTAQFNMTKADRVIYGTPVMENCGKAIAAFILAYTVREKRMAYLEECMGYFYALKTDLEFCADENIIKFPKKRHTIGSNGEIIPVESREDTINTGKIELFHLIGEIDGDICRWRASLAKGQDRA